VVAVKVTAADYIKNYGSLADRALSEPVTITKNGRDRLVILSAEEYRRLSRRDRRVIRAGELTDGEVALIARAEVPAEYAHLDEELKVGNIGGQTANLCRFTSAPAGYRRSGIFAVS
jgi:hypothetical protein